MRRYQVRATVQKKGGFRDLNETVIAANEIAARRIVREDYVVVRFGDVVDVTDRDTGWTHVAYVESDSKQGRTHEIRRNEKTGVVACGCKEFQFSKAPKDCHHLQALSLANAAQAFGANPAVPAPAQPQKVTVTSKAGASETFTVTRRAISLGPITIGAAKPAPTFVDGYVRIDGDGPVGVRVKESTFRRGSPTAIRINSGREAWDFSPAQVEAMIVDLQRAVRVYADIEKGMTP